MGDVGRLLSLGSFLGMGACIYTIAIVYTVSSVVWLDNNVLLVQYERFAIHTGPSTGKLRRAIHTGPSAGKRRFAANVLCVFAENLQIPNLQAKSRPRLFCGLPMHAAL